MIATASKPSDCFEKALKTLIVTTENSALQLAVASQIKSCIEILGFPHCGIVTIPEIAPAYVTDVTYIFLPELGQSFLYNITKENYACLQKIISSAQGLLWVTSGDNQSGDFTAGMVSGLARCVRGERPKMKFVTLALQRVQNKSMAVQNILKIFQRTVLTSSDGYETDYAERDGLLCISRLIEADYINQHIAKMTILQSAKPEKIRQDLSRRLKLSVGSPGLLDTLQFVDDENTLPIASDEIEILVKTSGLNFRDILIALGQDASNYLGMECAGVVSQAG